MDTRASAHSLFGLFGGVEESWMISQVSSNQRREVRKMGKEVEVEEDQVPSSSLAQLVLCSEPALESTQDHPPTLFLFGLEWWRKVG
jgi:hypothetical protein